MKKTKIAILFDSLFISILFSFLLFLWIRKYTKNAFFSYFVCILILILVFICIFLHFIKKYNLSKINSKQAKQIDFIINQTTYLSENEYIDFFENLLKAKHISGYIFFCKNLYFYINTKTDLDANDFHTANNFYLKSNKKNNLCFIGNGTTNDFTKLNSSSPNPYTFFQTNELIPLIAESKTLVVNTITKPKYKDKIKSKLPVILSRKNFKNYFISGVSLVTFSIFIPYSFYYLFVGSLLILISIITLFFKNYEPQNTKRSLKDIIKDWHLIFCVSLLFYPRIFKLFLSKCSTKSFLNFSISSPDNVWSKLESVNFNVTDFLPGNTSSFW